MGDPRSAKAQRVTSGVSYASGARKYRRFNGIRAASIPTQLAAAALQHKRSESVRPVNLQTLSDALAQSAALFYEFRDRSVIFGTW